MRNAGGNQKKPPPNSIYAAAAISYSTSQYGSASGTAIDAAAVTGENNTYGIATDFTNSCGLIFHRDAAGVVEAIGPSVQTTGADTKVIYQGDVIVGRLAYGCGAVRVGVAGAFRNT